MIGPMGQNEQSKEGWRVMGGEGGVAIRLALGGSPAAVEQRSDG